MLGSLGADLAVLAGFFDEMWIRPVSVLPAQSRAWLLNEVGFHLQALGRLREGPCCRRRLGECWYYHR